ncbi:MAG: sulfite exporter TauE/SafE family protein [Anaerolineae bacterium]|nr:sulfite exporter TauE/SafE family protein [Anaerolineae bacterium]MDW8102312.1 sulfite exporter TauE/SafE family protein [Anaerolineae bacterium]
MQNFLAFLWGGVIAVLGGLIGLGGAEFRLPVLVGIFKYRTLQAIVINLAISLVTVVFSFIFRASFTRFSHISANFYIILNVLTGSLLGAYIGVNFATKLNEQILTRVVVAFLLVLSFLLISHAFIASLPGLQLPLSLRILLGFTAGIVIGIFSSMLGVAGGEIIIPTVMIVFSVDIKLAGSLSLAISIPTIIMGLMRYHRQRKLGEIYAHHGFIAFMAAGSILGALAGSYLLRFVSSGFLHVLLGMILFTSALNLLRRKRAHLAV